MQLTELNNIFLGEAAASVASVVAMPLIVCIVNLMYQFCYIQSWC